MYGCSDALSGAVVVVVVFSGSGAVARSGSDCVRKKYGNAGGEYGSVLSWNTLA